MSGGIGSTWRDDPGYAGLVRALAPGRVLVTGGAVRDALLGIEPVDFDAVATLPAAVGRAALDAAGIAREAHPFLPDMDFVALPGGRIRDLSLGYVGAGPDLAEDARGRDFTCNAIYLAPDGGLVDPLGGIGDLRGRILRATWPDAFAADPVRILRAPRMLRRLGPGREADGLRGALSAAVPGLAGCPPVRVVRELAKLLDLTSADEAAADVSFLDGVGALRAIFPDADPRGFAAYCRMCEASGFDEGDEAFPRIAVLGARAGTGYDGRVASWGDERDERISAYARIVLGVDDGPGPAYPGVREALLTPWDGKPASAVGRTPYGVDPAEDPD